MTALSPPVEASRPTPTRYLGQRIYHPQHGYGLVVFEENGRNATRLLVVTLEGLHEVEATRMTAHGFGRVDGSVALPRSYRRLPGHDAIEGWAYDVNEAREALRGGIV